MRTIIAIDPGASGGIAIRPSNGIVRAEPMPETEGDLLALLLEIQSDAQREDSPITCYLENIVKHMGGGIPASTMAVYASNWGFIKGAVMALHIRLELVTPQSWQKSLGIGTSRGMGKRDWKNKLKSEAQRRYPSTAVTLKTADALLILEAALAAIKAVGQ